MFLCLAQTLLCLVEIETNIPMGCVPFVMITARVDAIPFARGCYVELHITAIMWSSPLCEVTLASI